MAYSRWMSLSTKRISVGCMVVAGLRVNDNHGHQAREQGVCIAKYIESNP